MSLSRRTFLGVAVAGTAGALLSRRLPALPAGIAPPRMVLYKSPSCGCCKAWQDHVQKAGFVVEAHDVPDVDPYKAKHGVPLLLSSCHTGIVGGYAIEGHVPADLIQKLLKERPKVVGLAVPGMPMGSPGMEGPTKDAYDVLAFTKDGKTSVYAKR
ncbi:MAG TPA: DUF411 domain-containing protein [Gemmatimonadaceae bacterium]|jgi:hypothetical protein|nr:DUF411 domain-containing protein [Gemmatimonadaceae bacterium]